jgi:chaperonin GroES
MGLKPLHDRIIVEPSEAERTTASGIILPDSAQEKPLTGTVVAVGPGKLLDTGKLSQMDVKTGDRVLYGKYAGTEVTIGGKDLVILRQEDVLAVVEGAPTKKPATKAVATAGKKGK